MKLIDRYLYVLSYGFSLDLASISFFARNLSLVCYFIHSLFVGKVCACVCEGDVVVRFCLVLVLVGDFFFVGGGLDWMIRMELTAYLR